LLSWTIAAAQSLVIERVHISSHQIRHASILADRVAALAEEELGDHAQPRVAELLGERAGSLPGCEGRFVLANEVKTVGPVGRHPTESPPVTERLGGGLRCAQVIENLGVPAQCRERVAQSEAYIDAVLEPGTCFR